MVKISLSFLLFDVDSASLSPGLKAPGSGCGWGCCTLTKLVEVGEFCL